jgi:peptidoglycan/xylan/chitin deacetylase (PgdA/CDA1 family)
VDPQTLITLVDALRLTRWADQMPRVPILLYHMIGRPGAPCDPDMVVAQPRFDEQLAHLAGAGYTCISLARLMDHVRRGDPVPPRSFVITFDDGFLDTYRLGWPVLHRHGMTATVFLVSDLIGRLSEWMRVEPSGPQLLMTRQHVRELQACGIDFGSHGCNHAHLVSLDDAALTDEVARSRETLSAELQVDPQTFAYPYGEVDARVRRAVESAGYAAAVSVRGGWNRRGTDPYVLRRIVVSGRDSPTALLLKMVIGEHRLRWTSLAARILRDAVSRLRGRKTPARR